MNKFFNFLGLAKRSGNLVEGYSKCDEQRNKVKFHLVILSDDAKKFFKEKETLFKKLETVLKKDISKEELETFYKVILKMRDNINRKD